MALDPVLGPIASALTPEAGGMPSHGAQASDFGKAMDQAMPGPSQPAAPDPVRTQALQPSNRTDSLGHQVLDSLERFGNRAQELQKLGSEAARRPPAKPSGPAALLRPAHGPERPSMDGAKADPKDPAADNVNGDYEGMFQDSMARQAKLFGLVIEVDLGRSVANTFTSTAKTLLTQSG